MVRSPFFWPVCALVVILKCAGQALEYGSFSLRYLTANCMLYQPIKADTLTLPFTTGLCLSLL